MESPVPLREYTDPDLAMRFRVYGGPQGPGIINLMTLRKMTKAALDDLTARMVKVEAALPFVTTAAVTPGVMTLGSKTLVVSVAGIKSGDIIQMSPQTDLPAGLVASWARASADGKISMGLSALLAITANTPITFDVLAWRKGS